MMRGRMDFRVRRFLAGRTQRSILQAGLAVAVLAVSLGPVETLSQRRRDFKAMSAEKQEKLFQSEEAFRKLPAQERQRIQDVHDRIESSPDRDKLLATMTRYCKWLETQPPVRSEKLRDKKLSPDERVATLEKFLKEQNQKPGKDIRLDEKSRQALAAWMKGYTEKHADQIIQIIVQGTRPGVIPGIKKLPPEPQKAVVRQIILRGWQRAGLNGPMPSADIRIPLGNGRDPQRAGPNGPMPITEPEMELLRGGLSPELRSKLDARKPPEQLRLIAEWLRETPSHELDEQLADFFENSIDDVERDRLMSLPGDLMHESLTKQFLAHVRSSEPPQRRNDPSRRNDRPPGMRGRHRGAPPGSGDGRLPRDNAEAEPGKEAK